MKMNAKALAPLALIAAFALGTLAPHAQTAPQKIGFVNVDTLFAANPVSKDVKALQTKYQTDINDLETKIKAIDAKGAAATAADKDNRKTLLDTYNAKVKDYETQMKAKTGPVEASVDNAISAYAKANGFTIIMDRTVAQQSGLVVYADNSTDVTEGVRRNVK